MTRREQIERLCEFNDLKARKVAIDTDKYLHNKLSNDEWFSRGAQWQSIEIVPIISLILEENEKLRGAFGCSSHSCRLIKPTGMGTNGPCHCLDNIKQVMLESSPLDELLKETK